MKLNERVAQRFGRFFPTGSVVFNEGDEYSNALYVILSGAIAIEKKMGSTSRVVHVMGEGDYFGEVSTFMQQPRSSTARATEDTLLAVIDDHVFHELLKDSSDVAFMMLREFSKRLVNKNKDHEEDVKSYQRLKALLFLIHEWPFEDNVEIIKVFADYCHSSVEDLQETLSWLEDQQVIQMKNKHITHFSEKRAKYISERI